MSDGWKHMPQTQPRTCDRCGAKITLNNYAWFQTSPPQWTRCKQCWPGTVTFQPDDCEYCKTVMAAIADAEEAHRAA